MAEISRADKIGHLSFSKRVQIDGRPFPAAQPTASLEGQRDTAFLDAISNESNNGVLGLWKVRMPYLKHIAENYRRHGAGPTLPRIYTKRTCTEFTHLLIHILRGYEGALRTLQQFKGHNLVNDELVEFTNSVYAVAATGLTLRALVYTSFFEEHLLRLRLHHPPPAIAESSLVDDTDPDHDHNPGLSIDLDLDLNLGLDLDLNPDDFVPDSDPLSNSELGADTDTDLDAVPAVHFPAGHVYTNYHMLVITNSAFLSSTTVSVSALTLLIV